MVVICPDPGWPFTCPPLISFIIAPASSSINIFPFLFLFQGLLIPDGTRSAAAAAAAREALPKFQLTDNYLLGVLRRVAEEYVGGKECGQGGVIYGARKARVCMSTN